MVRLRIITEKTRSSDESPQGAQKTPFRAGSDYFDLVKVKICTKGAYICLKQQKIGTAHNRPEQYLVSILLSVFL